eukprot:EG_transcript_10661
MSPLTVSGPQKTAPALVQPSAPAAPLGDMDVPICLDFLKGRCTRTQCRFLHPDLSQYEQLSGAVHARAGRRVCEVWAMTGQCKFGAKCNRLHPSVVVSQQPQPTMTMLLPLAAVPQAVLMAPLEAPMGPPTLLPPPHLTASWPPAPSPAGIPTAVPQVSVGRPILARQPPAARAPTSSAPVAGPTGYAAQPVPRVPPPASLPGPQHVMVPAHTAESGDNFQQLVRSILLMNLREKALRQPATTSPQSLPQPKDSQLPLNRVLLEMLRDLQGAGFQTA